MVEITNNKFDPLNTHKFLLFRSKLRSLLHDNYTYDDETDIISIDSSISKILTFNYYLPSKGKYGAVAEGETTEGENKVFIKLSLDISYFTLHEYNIMESLAKLKPFCPHFASSYALLQNRIDYHSMVDKVDSPFEKIERGGFKEDIIIGEYIDESIPLAKGIKDGTLNKNQIFSSIMQVLISLEIAQREVRFTHYDLHDENVLVCPCSKVNYNVYILHGGGGRGEEKIVEFVPTYGSIPMIIDYGFSYTDDILNKPLYGTMDSTSYGYMTAEFDSIRDPKLFLSYTSTAMYEKYRIAKTRKCKDRLQIYKSFRDFVLEVFDPIKMDPYSGWDIPYLSDDEEHDSECDSSHKGGTHKKDEKRDWKNDNDESDDDESEDEDKIPGAVEYVDMLIRSNTKGESKFIRRNFSFCLALIQSLNILPLRSPNETDNFEEYEAQLVSAFDAFTTEFVKIEKCIGGTSFKFYVLKQLVESIRRYKEDYDNNVPNTISRFKTMFLDSMTPTVKFFNPKDVDYEILFTSLLLLSGSAAFFYSLILKDKKKENRDNIDKIRCKKPLDFYKEIRTLLPFTPDFVKNSVLNIFDSTSKTTKKIILEEKDITALNNLHSYMEVVEYMKRFI